MDAGEIQVFVDGNGLSKMEDEFPECGRTTAIQDN